MKKVVFICPFEVERLTGTPIRAKTVVDCVATFSHTEVIAAGKLSSGKFFLKVFKNLNVLKPEVIHGFTTISVLPMVIYKLFHPKTKIIFEMHGWSWFETEGVLTLPKRIVFFLIDLVGYFFADGVIVMSYTQKNFLAKRFGSRKNVVVIWGPVNFPIVFEEARATDKLLIGYQGNNSWWQGLSILTQAAKILENNPNIHFQLAGFDYSDKAKFPETKNINYIGRFERKDAAHLIKNCAVMVSPRVAGNVSDLQYPQKLSEYLAAGRPVIASNISDQPMILKDASAGFIIADLNPESLADSILKFAELSQEERTELGRNAAKFAEENFSTNVFTQKLKDTYAHLN